MLENTVLEIGKFPSKRKLRKAGFHARKIWHGTYLTATNNSGIRISIEYLIDSGWQCRIKNYKSEYDLQHVKLILKEIL